METVLVTILTDSKATLIAFPASSGSAIYSLLLLTSISDIQIMLPPCELGRQSHALGAGWRRQGNAPAGSLTIQSKFRESRSPSPGPGWWPRPAGSFHVLMQILLKTFHRSIAGRRAEIGGLSACIIQAHCLFCRRRWYILGLGHEPAQSVGAWYGR